MSNVRKLKGKSFRISADFPKEIMEHIKRKMHQYKKAKAVSKQEITDESICFAQMCKHFCLRLLETALQRI